MLLLTITAAVATAGRSIAERSVSASKTFLFMFYSVVYIAYIKKFVKNMLMFYRCNAMSVTTLMSKFIVKPCYDNVI